MKYILLGLLFIILGVALFLMPKRDYISAAGLGSLGGFFIGIGYLIIKGHLD